MLFTLILSGMDHLYPYLDYSLHPNPLSVSLSNCFSQKYFVSGTRILTLYLMNSSRYHHYLSRSQYNTIQARSGHPLILEIKELSTTSFISLYCLLPTCRVSHL